MNKPLVIYHADCTDGFCAAFAAWLKLGDEAEYRPTNYNEGIAWAICVEDGSAFDGRDVYILDFSFKREHMEYVFQHAKRVVWLDHHKTAFEMWCETERELHEDFNNLDRSIRLDNNKSGALLAWEYFHPDTEVPMLIKHIDDRDRWQFKLDGSKELHAAINTYPKDFVFWHSLLFESDELINEGAAILRAQDAHVKDMLKQARKCRIEVFTKDGNVLTDCLHGLALNTNMHMSEVGYELANKSGAFGLVWYLTGDGSVACSLRSNGDYDVLAIARVFGGGGHRNAAGFETDIQTLMGWLS